MRIFFFFFQAEDGIRDIGVTGVQTCALPISWPPQCRLVLANLPYGLRGCKGTVRKDSGSVNLGEFPFRNCPKRGASNAPTLIWPVCGARIGSRKIGRASCRERV